MKYIKLVLDNLNIKPNSEIKGHVTVNYPGAYDGVVINTLIIGSNKLIVYKSYNDEKISDNVSRLFISRDVMPDNKAQFTAVIEFEPEQSHDVKFRASIIEQHKEVEQKSKAEETSLDDLTSMFEKENLANNVQTFMFQLFLSEFEL